MITGRQQGFMHGIFSESTIEQVRAASDIVDVIGAALPLKRAGANFVALCPFHHEKTPSFNVNPQRQVFHCFGCHKGGDVFAFVREYEGVTFPEAVRRLAERARIPLETEQSPDQQRQKHLKESLLLIHEQITRRWETVLENDAAGEAARAYLDGRGVGREARKLFRLGCAPDAWDDTVNWARAQGHDLGLVEKSGLILRKEGSDHYYDRFRGRLMFPVCDEQGRVIAFSGRVIQGDEKTAKYVNSPETPIFSKSRVFFGLDKSKRALLDAESAVVCEGQLDLIACYMAGIRNVVAPQGTAFTASHARILKRYVDEVVLCFDSDPAGRNASIRSLDDLLASGLAVRVASIPAPHDPDSFIREQGASGFAALIEGAPDFFEFYLRHLCETQDAGADRGRIAIVQSMASSLVKTGNAVLVDTYAQKTAHRLGVSVDAVRAEFRKGRIQGRPDPGPSTEADGATGDEVPRPTPHEFWLMKLLLVDDTLIEWGAAHLDLAWIQHAAVRAIVTARLDKGPGVEPGTIPRLLGALEDPVARNLITEAIADAREIPDRPRQLADVMKRLRDLHIDRQLAEMNRRQGLPDLSDEDRMELLRRRQELQKAKRSPVAV